LWNNLGPELKQCKAFIISNIFINKRSGPVTMVMIVFMLCGVLVWFIYPCGIPSTIVGSFVLLLCTLVVIHLPLLVFDNHCYLR